ncbi:MAG TPA: hypothetical protein VGH44_03835 [Candidatus Saccharimonadia bacterium]|jgi:hypothetical protein
MKHWFWRSVVGLTIVGAVAIVVLVLLPKPPIPGAIKKQLTSTLLVPKDSRFVVDRQSAKYDASLKLLTFNTAAFGQQVVISEQPSPDTFADIPDYYSKLVNGMNSYSDFDTAIGTVHLTRPLQLGGKQAAVLNAKGTLLFAKSASDLSDDQWRQFFNTFDFQH